MALQMYFRNATIFPKIHDTKVLMVLLSNKKTFSCHDRTQGRVGGGKVGQVT
jgi:hypothetical protein